MIDLALFNPCEWRYIKSKGDYGWSFDRAVEPITLDWNDIVDALSEPLIVDEKEMAPMINFQTFVPYEQIQDDPTRIFAKDWRTTKRYTKAIADNVVTTTAITVDMESEHWPISRFVKQWSNFEFFLGTSFKHASEVDYNFRHRYRAFFPLVEPLHIDHLRKPSVIEKDKWTVLPHLQSLFEGCDKSTFDRSRCVFFPSCPPDREHQFTTVHNKGKIMDWRELRQTNGTIGKPQPPPKAGSLDEMNKRMRQMRYANVKWNGVDDCPFVKKEALNQYLSTPHGEHHRALFKFQCSIAGRANALGRPLDQHELEALAREAHLMLPCSKCDKSSRDYHKEAGKVLAFCSKNNQ